MESLSSDVLYLDRNENSDPILNQYISSILHNINVSKYPSYEDFVKNLSTFYDIPPETIIPTSGCTEAIKIAIDSFLEKEGLTILKKPTYTFASELIQSKTNNIVYYNDDKRIIKYLETIKPKFFYLCNPNNPTGEVLEYNYLRDIIKLCHKINCKIFIDETYYEFAEVSTLELCQKYQNLMVGRSFSKAWGCAGLRMGFIASNLSNKYILDKFRLKASINTIGVGVISNLIKNYSIVKDSIDNIKKGFPIIESIILQNNGRILSKGMYTNFIYFSSKNDIFKELNTKVRKHEETIYTVAVPCYNLAISKFLPFLQE